MIARRPAGASLAAALSFAVSFLCATGARAEVILQFFETPWAEVEARMPEIAAAGYDAIWLPPPTKGTEGLRDVGFATYDRFDLGDRFQRGTVATRYGAKGDLLSLVDTAHRFGVRVYFDVIMNHNGNPNTVENPGVDLPMVDLDAWPDTSVFDFHVLPAKVQSSCAGQSGCAFCAFQPAADNAPDWKVVRQESGAVALNVGGGDICIRQNQLRVSSVTFDDAIASLAALDPTAANEMESDPIFQLYVTQGFTHFVRSPDVGDFGGFSFELMNWALLGLQDFATEQYLGAAAFADGRNSINGLPLPEIVRNPGEPELYPDSAEPVPEDIRAYLMRWIRWLMLETGADGFRLDAVKHVFPNFYASDFANDPIAFNNVIQDTYDELNGLSDGDDTDLVDDAAIFGENFTGSFGELSPYVDTGMRMLDFPLYFRTAGFKGSGSMYGYGGDWGGNADIGQLSVRPNGSDIGGFGGLHRYAGVGFAQSHDKCQGHESVDDAVWGSPNFSRCYPEGGQPDLIYSFVVLRDADSVVFFDGNNWTNESFVRAGRADALGDTFGGAAQRTVVEVVSAARRVARGEQRNMWVGSDAYAFERFVAGQGAAGIVVLDDRLGRDATFGNDSQAGSFILTSFPPGTELVELTGNALAWAETVTVLEPDVLDDNPAEAPEVQAARDNYAAANGAQPANGFGVIYTGFPGGRYVVYAPEAVRAADVVVKVGGAAATTTSVTTATGKVLPDGTAVTDASVEMYVVPAGSSFTLEVTRADGNGAPVPVVAAQLDGDASLLPGTPLSATQERFLDGFVPLADSGGGVHSLANISTAGLAAGVHGIRVRFARDVLGAAQAQDEIVLPLCVGVAADCEPAEPSFPPPPDVVDAGPDPDDAGSTVDSGPPDEDGGVIIGDDAGQGQDAGPDDAGIDPGADDDGDDVVNAEDNCPFEANRDQADFDEDGVGDLCDLCPVGVRGRPVDGDGCPLPTAQEKALILEVARAIAEGASGPPALDLDQSGAIDVGDLDVAIGRAHVPLAEDGGTP